jgi:hypothetical protein
MLCLYDSIRHDDPAMQRLLRAVGHAHSLITFAGVVWTIDSKPTP